MAEAKKKTTKKPIEKTEQVTRAEFNDVKAGVSAILGILEKQQTTQLVTTPAGAKVLEEPADIATVSPAQSEKARSNRVTVNPDWEETAREILGDWLDHTEVEHEKSGGLKFTVVIKNEYSNADQQYLEMTKVDRRTKEVSAEGLSGVEEWCRQIKANISRTHRAPARG